MFTRAAFVLVFAVPRTGTFVAIGQEPDAGFDMRSLGGYIRDQHVGSSRAAYDPHLVLRQESLPS